MQAQVALSGRTHLGQLLVLMVNCVAIVVLEVTFT